MSDFDAVNTLANEEVDFAIKMIPSFANLFRNQTVDFERIGVQREADFYLGAAWVTATNFFAFDFVKKFKRSPTMQENMIVMQAVYTRLPELRRAISDLGI